MKSVLSKIFNPAYTIYSGYSCQAGLEVKTMTRKVFDRLPDVSDFFLVESYQRWVYQLVNY